MKQKHISVFDLDKIRDTILRNYPTVNTKRSIIDKDILNFFLGMNIKKILKYKPNHGDLSYEVWYEEL